jgi:hypothetical protein
MVLKVREIETYYGAIAALRGISFEVDLRDIVTILEQMEREVDRHADSSGITPPIRGSIEFWASLSSENLRRKLFRWVFVKFQRAGRFFKS